MKFDNLMMTILQRRAKKVREPKNTRLVYLSNKFNKWSINWLPVTLMKKVINLIYPPPRAARVVQIISNICFCRCIVGTSSSLLVEISKLCRQSFSNFSLMEFQFNSSNWSVRYGKLIPKQSHKFPSISWFRRKNSIGVLGPARKYLMKYIES